MGVVVAGFLVWMGWLGGGGEGRGREGRGRGRVDEMG